MMQLLASSADTQTYDALFWLVAAAFVIIFAAMCLYGRVVDRRHVQDTITDTSEADAELADSTK